MSKKSAHHLYISDEDWIELLDIAKDYPFFEGKRPCVSSLVRLAIEEWLDRWREQND